MLRESGTWALVDPLVTSVAGPILDRAPELSRMLDTAGPRTTISGSAGPPCFALLPGPRRGDGDFDRFSRYADAMLDDPEFFVRKAIGWVLRDTARRRPDIVYEWLLPRAARASAVTVREAVKPLSERQRAAVLVAR